MSSFEADPFESLPAYQRLTQLEGQEAVLVVQLQSDDFVPQLRPSYERALERVAEQKAEVAGSTDLQIELAKIGQSAVRGLDQLEPLRTILSAEELKDTEESLQGRLERVATFYERYGAVTAEAQSFLSLLAQSGKLAVKRAIELPTLTSAEPTEPKAPVRKGGGEAKPKKLVIEEPEAGETLVQSVTLTFRDKAVRVGREGKIFPYSKRSSDSHHDYSEERRSALIFIAESQNRSLSPHQIWTAIHGDHKPFDRNAMTSIRKWLTGISFRRQPLIITNQKTGNASRYSVAPGFELEVHIPRSKKERIELPPGSSRLDLDEHVAEVTEQTQAEAQIAGVKLSSLYLVGLKLSSLNGVLRAYNKPEVSHEMLDSMEVYKPDLSGLKSDYEKLDYRERSLREIHAVFENEDRILDLIDCLDKENPEVGFVEYIYRQFEDPTKRQFMNRLIRSRWEMNVTLFKGIPEHIDQVLVDQFGEVIWPISTKEGWLIKLPEDAEPSDDLTSSVYPPTQEGVSPEFSQELSEANETHEDDRSEEITQERRTNLKKRQRIDQLAEKTQEIVDTFLEHFSPEHSYSRNQIQSVFNVFSSSSNKDASEANMGLKRKQRTAKFNLSEIVDIMLHDNANTRNLVEQRKNRRVIKRVTEKIIQNSVKKHSSQKEDLS